MKKFLILFFFLLIPKVNAYEITNYDINLTILENGNIDVAEIIEMTGDYNGFERIIKYKNNYNDYKTDKLVLFDKKLYDGNDIVINNINGFQYIEETLEENLKLGDSFVESNFAAKGDYGLYKVESFSDGESFKIYNPSKYNKNLYINYTLKNMVITHEDISEVMFPLFYDMEEFIRNLEITINIPNNKNMLEAYVHGVENKINRIDEETIKISIDNFNTENYFDFRVIFDDLDTNKISKQFALESIINLEENLNQDFNDKEDKEQEQLKENAYNLVNIVQNSLKEEDYYNAYEAVDKLSDKDELKTQLLVKLMNIKPKVERRTDIINISLTSILIVWLIGEILIWYYTYKKYNVKVEKNKIVKEIPSDYSPATLGYLMHKKISKKDLVASILYLIDKKVIQIKKLSNDYLLKRKDAKVTPSEEWLLKFIFDNKKQIKLQNFEHRAKKYDDFLNIYSNWLNIATNEAESKGYFFDMFYIKIISIIYSVVGIIISLFLIDKQTYFSSLFILLFALISLVYYIKLYKRTLLGKTEYYKWKGIKKYIEKICILDKENIPTNINSYITYSISLKCSNKISKELKIDDYIFEIYNSIMYAINIAYLTKKITNSKYSSIKIKR